MIYTGKNLKEIIFPLGGIGTGSIGLCGNGMLEDWEIFNRPNKGGGNGYTFMAVRAKKADGTVITRVLQSDVQKELMGRYLHSNFEGYGYGPHKMSMCGFPHFKTCIFDAKFPFATLTFEDEVFPAKVVLTAFNPFIPLDSFNSSLPSAIFNISLEGKEDNVEYTVVFSLNNPFEDPKNSMRCNNGYREVHLTGAKKRPDEFGWGELSLICDDKNAFATPCWYSGEWQDGIATFWREFTEGRLKERQYDSPGEGCISSITRTFALNKGKQQATRFVLSWYVPNNRNDWFDINDEKRMSTLWKNYYATVFKGSGEVAAYVLENCEDLESRSAAFADTIFSATLDESIIDAATSSLCVLKSPTVWRLEDGSFYGWEGVHEKNGSCEGICQHVWNYAYALCFLFPDLERSIRDLQIKYNMGVTGSMRFRLPLPLGFEQGWFRPCVDGQMGEAIKLYREWKISGDDEWMRGHLDHLYSMVSFAFNPENQDKWDADKDGVLEGRQHHTLDMELFGPSAWLEGFYLTALKSSAEIFRYFGRTKDAEEFEELYAKGVKYTRENLFNGKYFIHKVDIENKAYTEKFNCDKYWNYDFGELKYQIGEGCIIDQLLAQWHAHILGLGDIFDKEQRKIACENMYKILHKQSMREFTNPWRIYSLNDEAGTIICGYPENTRKPVISIPYSEETMTGMEYAFAGLLMSEGFYNEGLSVVKAVRDRYNGENRNPFNEIECGSNYARCMAAFALIPIMGGFSFDLPARTIGFNPKFSGDFKTVWSLGTGWGSFERTENTVKITLLDGKINLKCVKLPFAKGIKGIKCDGKDLTFTFNGGNIEFEEITTERQLEIEFD